MGQGGFTVKTQRLKFLNSPKKCFFPFPHCALMEDIDGSVVGLEGSHLLPSLDILPDSCREVEGIGGGATASVCGAHIKFHRMSIGLGSAPSTHYNVTIINTMNQTTTVNYVQDTLSNLYGWQALLLDAQTYTVIFHSPDMRSSLHYSATFDEFEAGDYMFVKHCNLLSVLNISIACGTKFGKPRQSIPPPGESEGCDWIFDSHLGVLTYLVAGEGQVRVTLTAERGTAPPTPAPTSQPRPVSKWSSPESWAGVGDDWGGYNSKIPQAGDNVIILPNVGHFSSLEMNSKCGGYGSIIPPPTVPSFHQQRFHHATTYGSIIPPPTVPLCHQLRFHHATSYGSIIPAPTVPSCHHLRFHHSTTYGSIMPPPTVPSFYHLRFHYATTYGSIIPPYSLVVCWANSEA
ncbi:fibrocystin-like [Mixophyes fleayi]|uniref:fibrocystin-like n=1 Tax=Mixophyes fleayi TaxID=3061075 RepID=UPI003F4DFED5